MQKNLTLILAFSLPILLILIVAISTYLPSIFLSTKYNFIYALCGESSGYYYGCTRYIDENYTVQNNKLVRLPPAIQEETGMQNETYTPPYKQNLTVRIFLHDTDTNESREISTEEAQMLTLDSKLTSPDGITVSGISESTSGGYFFPYYGSSSSFNYYLTKGKNRKKLNLINKERQYYYSDNFKFLGWVLPGRN